MGPDQGSRRLPFRRQRNPHSAQHPKMRKVDWHRIQASTSISIYECPGNAHGRKASFEFTKPIPVRPDRIRHIVSGVLSEDRLGGCLHIRRRLTSSQGLYEPYSIDAVLYIVKMSSPSMTPSSRVDAGLLPTSKQRQGLLTSCPGQNVMAAQEMKAGGPLVSRTVLRNDAKCGRLPVRA